MSSSVSQVAKLRWAAVRRFLGLIFSVYFCASTIKTACRVCDANGCGSLITNLTFWAWAVHCLYFFSQLDLSYVSHPSVREFHCFLHSLSLGLSVYVAFAVSVLFMYSPSFTQRHADAEKLPVATVWFFSILAHYVPPLLHVADFLVLKEELFLHYRPPLQYARAPFILRISAIALGPALLLAVWSLMFTTDQVYAVSIPPSVTYSIAAVVLLVVPAVFARLLLRMSASAQYWLHKQDSAVAGIHAQDQRLLQPSVYM